MLLFFFFFFFASISLFIRRFPFFVICSARLNFANDQSKRRLHLLTKYIWLALVRAFGLTAVSKCVDNSLIRKYSQYYCLKYLCYWPSMLSYSGRSNFIHCFCTYFNCTHTDTSDNGILQMFSFPSLAVLPNVVTFVFKTILISAINTRPIDVKLRKALLLLIFELFFAALWQSALLCSGFFWLPNERSILMRFPATTKIRNCVCKMSYVELDQNIVAIVLL